METFEHFDFNCKCGEKLSAVKLTPKAPVGIIILIHGMGEHCERYLHWATRFKNHGIGWYSFDLPGHGKSSGKRGHFRSMASLMSIINEFTKLVRKEHKTAPLILYGHSMGGNLVFNYLLREDNPFKMAIVTSPWIRLVHPPTPMMIKLADIMHLIYPGFTQSSGLKATDMSSVHQESEWYEKDPLNHKKISANAFHLIHHGGLFIEKHIKSLKIPVYLAHSNEDPLTSFQASEKLAVTNPGMIQFNSFDKARHELHHDISREKLFADEIQFIQSMLQDGAQNKA